MPEDKKIPSIELRTEKVQDILGHIPNWIVRWGMLTFLVVILLLIGGSHIFRYPHIVMAPMKVTTENPPAEAIARTDGRIMRLFVVDNQQVEAGQVLALIENTAEFNHVQLLSRILDSIQDRITVPDSLLTLELPLYLRLGDIQNSYATFVKNLEDLKNFLELNYHNLKVSSIENEIERFKAYSWTLKKQSKILLGERDLAMNQFNRDSTLFVQGVIPEADYEKSKSSLLQTQRAYEVSRSTLVNSDIEIARLQQQILDLKLQRSNELGKLQLSVQETYENLVADLAEWEHRMVLRTNVAGTVSFTRFWSENQNVTTGELVMTVIPENPGDIIGKLELPVKKSGKVKPQQDVNVKFDNFPYMEYGIVRARIKTISLVTDNNAYSVLVEFPNGLSTNSYGDDIIFSQDMQALAEIITNEESLLERIINPVRSVIMRQKQLRAKK